MAKNRGPHRGEIVPSTMAGPIHLRVIRESGYYALAEVAIDYSKTAVPDRAYYADQCDVKKSRSGVTLFFGKLIPGTEELRTQVEISYPDDMFVKQFWATSRDMHKMLLQEKERFRLEPLPTVKMTDKVQTFRANIAFIGTWGDEAVADFYYLSPRDMHYLKSGISGFKPILEPVLRVAMYPGLLLEVFEKAKDIVPALEALTQEVVST